MRIHKVKYIRRTKQELKTWREDVRYWTDSGLPRWKAEEYAWDAFWAHRIAKRKKVEV